MRRFSQKNALVTLADINVTPLLDLAFVLLIIFVITTPLLEQGLTLQLPSGGRPDTSPLRREDIRRVEISAEGSYLLEGTPRSVDEIENLLASDFQRNPRLVVDIRADRRTSWENVLTIMDRCQRHGITQIHPRTVAD